MMCRRGLNPDLGLTSVINLRSAMADELIAVVCRAPLHFRNGRAARTYGDLRLGMSWVDGNLLWVEWRWNAYIVRAVLRRHVPIWIVFINTLHAARKTYCLLTYLYKLQPCMSVHRHTSRSNCGCQSGRTFLHNGYRLRYDQDARMFAKMTLQWWDFLSEWILRTMLYI